MERHFRAGHPWVFSNELAESPKGIEPGSEIELREASGKFIARGYGNAFSLIAFRTVTRESEESDALQFTGIFRRLKRASEFRYALGFVRQSHRLCFGEADALPGLIVDRYFLSPNGKQQVFVIQMQTAGIDYRREIVLKAIEALVTEEQNVWGYPSFQDTAIIIRNDVSARKLDGINEEEPRTIKEIPGVSLSDSSILVRSAWSEEPLAFSVNLFGGQKTGFFLDQAINTRLAVERLKWPIQTLAKKEVRILDLCSYVGQWSTQLSGALRSIKIESKVTAVDASASALDFARRNVESVGAEFIGLKGDVLRDLGSVSETFDIVVSDPPALIKSRKEIPQGTHAYVQINTQALRLLSRGGCIISSSCSGLLSETEFAGVLAKAANRQMRKVKWIARGGQSPDHPILAEFPEGKYLKTWIGIVDV